MDITLTSRKRISLDGSWQFQTDPDASLSISSLIPENWIQVIVPAPWQSQSPELRDYAGAAWYQRTFKIPPEWLASRNLSVILGIDAADWEAQAWLNGVPVGEHRGGYLPFELDVSSAAQPGFNTLTLRVDDSPELFPEVPHGKQGWYGPLSGLWQPVWLESRPDFHITSLQVYSDLDHGCIEAQVEFSRLAPTGAQVRAKVTAPEGMIAAQDEFQLAPQARGARFDLLLSMPKPWSPETPYLYSLEVEILDGNGKCDSYTKSFGFRSIETRDGRLYLNGEPIYLRAALDQDYYPDTICSVPSVQFLEDQARKAKELGLNCLRCHIKVADPRYYEVADRLGLLIWTELPNWSTFTEAAEAYGRETLQGILRRDGHHPSIIIWTIINEDWGLDLVNDPAHRTWLKEAYQWLRALDPSRLVVDNSACEPNFHVQTDLEDFHYYRQLPDHRQEWDAFLDKFASRAPFTFSPHGDAIRNGKEPLILSEFGNWGLPDIERLSAGDGKDPWWFGTGIEWGEGVVYPQGVKGRFHRLGLDKVFGSWGAFVKATQEQQFLALKYGIETMRRHTQICGYVITELTDVHWEANGLLDLNRNPKVFHADLKNFNADTVIIPVWERTAFIAGETVRVGLSVAHAAGNPIQGAVLTWRLDNGELAGQIILPTLKVGQVVDAGEISFAAPHLAGPAVRRLLFELRSKEGHYLAQNYLDLVFHPERPISGLAPVLYSEDPVLARVLAERGYPVVSELEAADLFVTGEVNPQVITFVREGGRLLLLADRGASPRPGPGVPPAPHRTLLPKIRLVAREGTPWDGDWASTFSWLKRKGPFTRLPGGPLLDHSFDRIFPDYVMLGFGDWDYQAWVYAGLVVGWVHRPVALIAKRSYGRGKAVLNSFRMDDAALASDPTAGALLDGCIQLALA